METVTIGCRLPLGIMMEVGIANGGRIGSGKPFQLLQRTENYKKHLLRGTNALPHLFDPQGKRIQAPAALNPDPYINTRVPKDIWDEWIKTHPGFLKAGHLFVVEDKGVSGAANTKAAIRDSMDRPGIMQPADPDKIIVPGIVKGDFTQAA